jgi:hypothetical protein
VQTTEVQEILVTTVTTVTLKSTVLSIISERRGIGIELKPSYYRQTLKNMGELKDYKEQGEMI